MRIGTITYIRAVYILLPQSETSLPIRGPTGEKPFEGWRVQCSNRRDAARVGSRGAGRHGAAAVYRQMVRDTGQ